MSHGKPAADPAGCGAAVFAAALLGILDDACVAVLTMTEGVEEAAFAASRLTRPQTRLKLLQIVDSAASLPAGFKSQLSGIDWAGWERCGEEIRHGSEREAEALWFAVRSLVPATRLWLVTHRHRTPELFRLLP